VNRLNTENNAIPYEYHDFDFCQADETYSPVESLGQIVLGDRIKPSPYNIKFLEDKTCQVLCRKSYKGGDLDSENRLKKLKKGMSLNYQHNWIVDNMPVVWCFPLTNDREYCSAGFPMGCHKRSNYPFEEGDSCPINFSYDKPGTYYPFNHVDLTIVYQSGASGDWGNAFEQYGGRIIKIKAVPSSVKHEKYYEDCNSQTPIEIPEEPLRKNVTRDIIYTYSVKFVQDNTIEWSSRWDFLTSKSQSSIQWYSMTNSLVVASILAGVIAVIMQRKLRKNRNGSADSGKI